MCIRCRCGGVEPTWSAALRAMVAAARRQCGSDSTRRRYLRVKSTSGKGRLSDCACECTDTCVHRGHVAVAVAVVAVAAVARHQSVSSS